MKTKTKTLPIVVGVIISLLIIFSVFYLFDRYYYSSYGYREFGEYFKKLDEVKLLYEKYDDVRILYSMHETLSYDVFIENASLSLEVYHNKVDKTANQLVLYCYTRDGGHINEDGTITYKTYTVNDDDILEYLQNDECFGGKHP